MRYEPAIINVSGSCQLICVMGRVPAFALSKTFHSLTLSLPAGLQALIPAFSCLYIKLHSRPHSHRSRHENPSFINTSISSQELSITVASLFLPSEKIYFYFFPPCSPALPCSVLSSLALCVTPTQGLREMNGLIPVGKE